VGTTFASNADDLVAAAGFLAAQYAAPQLLIGHSLGGAASLLAAQRIPSVTAVATINAPCSPAHLVNLLGEARDQIAASGQATVQLGGAPVTISRPFLDNLAETNMLPAIHALDRALLICHSPVDAVVGVDNAARIFEAACHPKSFVSLDQADHMLSHAADARYTGALIAAWASRYIAAPTATAATTAQGEVLVETPQGGFVTHVTAGNHQLIVDEPVSVGGSDLGPNPYELLAAALGACTTITLRMYADRKGIPLEKAVARLRHEKIHAADCESCETSAGKIDQITRELEFVGPLDDAQRAKLREIADKCPVHRTLEGEILVTTSIR
ncbi:MAG: OsmC family protein, partial [Roseiflexaceae bacterium]|nr:OsmC family protein [Roseiflexaceae bacterium]